MSYVYIRYLLLLIIIPAYITPSNTVCENATYTSLFFLHYFCYKRLMKCTVSLLGKTLYTFMRQAGYAPDGQDAKTNQFRFYRSLNRSDFPKFHVYASSADTDTAVINLHLDQKKPSYGGSNAHSGEYDSPLVQQEVSRITNLQ